MKVKVKEMDVNMEVKNNGIEFEIRNTDDTFLGDCIVNKKGLIWCQGKTSRENGKQVSWDKFIQWMVKDK